MKRKLIVFFLLLPVVATMAYLIFRPGNEAPVKKDYFELRDEGVLKIVTNMDPVGYYASSDSIIGYNHDMLEALQKYTPLKFEISVENSLEASFRGLEEDKYDIVARNIPINSILRNEYSFTQPTVHNKLILVQRKAEFNGGQEPIRNHLQLARKVIYIPKDSPSKFRLKNLSREIGDTIYVVEDSLYEASHLAMMVAAGDIGFSVCDSKTAKKLALSNPELDIKTDIGFTHLEGWAVRANSPILLDSLNSWIDRFKSTQEYVAILAKYNM